MDKVGAYDVQPFTKARQDITVISREGKRRLNVHALIEVDVTKAREMITNSKGTIDVSFTGWIVKCVGQAASEHKQMNAYRLGRKKIVFFDDVDIPIPVERKINGEQRPLAYIVRKANEKTVADITKEIREAQHQTIDASTEVLGETLTHLEQWVLHAPLWIKKLGIRLMRGRGLLKKKHFGTIGVTAIGMKGRFPGWVLGWVAQLRHLLLLGVL